MKKLELKWKLRNYKYKPNFKQQEMQLQHQFDMQLKGMEVESYKVKRKRD